MAVSERGNGKIVLREGHVIVHVPKCGFCRQYISKCKCGKPAKRPC